MKLRIFIFLVLGISIGCKTGQEPTQITNQTEGVSFILNGQAKSYSVAYYKDIPSDRSNERQVGMFSFLTLVDSGSFTPCLAIGSIYEVPYWRGILVYNWSQDFDSVAISKYIPGLIGLDTIASVGQFVTGNLTGPINLYYVKSGGIADTSRLYGKIEQIKWNGKRIQ